MRIQAFSLCLLLGATGCDDTVAEGSDADVVPGAGGKADDSDSTSPAVIQENITREFSWGREGDLSERDVEIMDWFRGNGEFGSFDGVAGNQGEPSIRVNYAVFRAREERAALVLVTGRTESYRKYAEFAYDLMQLNGDLGYSLYIIDHRGQGYSERMLKRNPELDHERGYVHNFEDYVEDLRTFVDDIVRPSEHERVFGLAHSLGGGVMTRYLQAYHGDEAFDAVILTSPMHGIAAIDREDTGGPRGWAMEYASLQALRAMVAARQGWRYVPGGGGFDSDWGFFSGEEGNSVTHSLPRHRFTNGLYLSEPKIWLGSSTARWVVEAHDACEAMKVDPANELLETPVLLLQAGEEMIVSNPDQSTVCDAMANCRLEVVPGSRHEPIFEVDRIRDDYLNRMVSFYEGFIR